MKKTKVRKSIRQSSLSALVVSALILALFIFLGVSTIGGTSQQKFQLPDGRWELSRYLSGGKTEIITGNVDNRGRFDGPVIIVHEKDFEKKSTEYVDMVAGIRHGKMKLVRVNGPPEYYCFEMGEVIKVGPCEEKSASVRVEDHSAYQIFSYELPWFAFKLEAFGYDSVYVKAYLDTLESVLYSEVFPEEEFDDHYVDAIDMLEETPYDSIIQMNAELSIYNGLDLILNHEFRLASLDSYENSEINTYNVVKSIYPNYLIMLNEFGVTDSDFEGFCSVYDEIMSSYEPVALDDPYYLDSMDTRMYRTMDSISSSDEESAAKSLFLKSAVLPNSMRALRAIQQEYISQSINQTSDMTPAEVSEVVILSILESFLHGDLIRSAVREAYAIKEGIVRLPTVVTVFSSNNSSTSVTLSGNVIDNGGGQVTERGIAWGTIYNPTTDNPFTAAGSGTGDFSVNLTELTEGVTYFARAFATNSTGTAYGNCITFVTASTIGIDSRIANSFDFTIYPNPASDHVTLTFKAKDPKSMIFTIFDMSGRSVLHKSLTGIVLGENIININISEIKSGNYTCRIEGEENIYAIQKLIIIR